MKGKRRRLFRRIPHAGEGCRRPCCELPRYENELTRDSIWGESRGRALVSAW